MVTRASIWREVGGPAVLLLVVLGLFGDVLFVHRGEMLSAAEADGQTQFVPWREFAKREVLEHHHLPLWNPHVFCGTPFVGAMQVGAFYPPNWLGLVMGVGTSINWEVALHAWLAGVFMYGWARYRGVGRVGGTVAGCVYVMCSPYLLHLLPGHVPFLCVAAWSPLVMWCGEGMVRWGRWGRGGCGGRLEEEGRSAKADPTWVVGAGGDGGRRRWPGGWGLVGALAVGMQVLGGYPQPAYIVGLVGTVYLVVGLIGTPWRRAGVVLATWVGMYVVGALLAGVQLGAGVAAGGETGRSGRVPWEFAVSYSVPGRNWVEAVVPGIWGDVLHGRYHSEWLNWEVTPYFGAGALGLLVVAVVCGRGRRRWVLLGLAAGCAVAAMGDGTPVYRVLYWVVPGVARFRVPGRFLYAAGMFVALLAGMGVDAARERPRRAMIVGVGMVGVAVGVVVLGGVIRSTGVWADVLAGIGEHARHLMQVRPETLRSDGEFVRKATLAAGARCFVAALAVGACGMGLVLARWRPRAGAVAAGVLAVAELFAHAWGGIAYCDPHVDYPAAWRGVAAALPGERVICPIEKYANTGMRYGIDNVLGYDPVVLRRYAQLLAWCDGERDVADVVEARYLTRPPAAGVMAMTRVGAALVDERGVLPVAGAMGEVEVVGRAEVLATREAVLGRVCSEGFDPRSVVVLERAPAIVPAGGKGVARVVRETTDEIEVEATVDGPAVLLVTDAYSSGWVVRGLSGSAQTSYEVVPADGVLRGVAVGAGRHHFVMVYRPWEWGVGEWVTGGSVAVYLMGCCAWVVGGWRRVRCEAK